MSQKRTREHEKPKPDPLKLLENQLSNEVLQKIDRLIAKKLKNVSIANLVEVHTLSKQFKKKETESKASSKMTDEQV